MVARRRRVNAVEAAQVADFLEYVDRARVRGERLGGADVGELEISSAAHELSMALTLPAGVIDRQIANARFLRAAMPTAWDGWRAGSISLQESLLIGDAARRLKYADSLLRLDEQVIAVAEPKTLGQLRSWLNRFVARVEPTEFEHRHEVSRRERRVHLQAVGDGMCWVSALIPSVDAVAIDSALDEFARQMSGGTHDQKRADALVSQFGASDGTAAHIGVIVPIQSLMGLSDDPGEFSDRSDAIPASTIRGLALGNGALFWRLLTDETGRLLDVKRMGRFADEDIAMAVRFRDGTSVFPTSAVPADRCDIDHSAAYPAPTTADNLGPLHRRAHNLKTRGMLSMRQPEPGAFEWTTSTGHRYTHTADRLPVAQWDETPGFDSAFLEAMAHEPEVFDPAAPPDDMAA